MTPRAAVPGFELCADCRRRLEAGIAAQPLPEPPRGLSSIPPFIREHRKVTLATFLGALLASFGLELARALGWLQ